MNQARCFDNDNEDLVILFDGVCNLCNKMVQFIIKHDPNAVFRFASLQSAYAEHWITHCGLETERFVSIILIDRGQAYIKSDAVIGITARLQRPWSFIRLGRLLPRRFRDKLYDLLATHRYQWFGISDTCMVPDPEIRTRFLE